VHAWYGGADKEVSGTVIMTKMITRVYGKKYSDSTQKTAYLINLTKQQAVDERNC